MVKCEHCGYDNKDKSKYCVRCSKKLLTSNLNETLINKDKQEDNELTDLYYTFLQNQRANTYNQQAQPEMNQTFPSQENTQQFSRPVSTQTSYEVKDPDDNPHSTTSRMFIATTLSLLICGLGFVYLGESRRCANLLISELIVFIIAFLSYRVTYTSILVYALYFAAILIYIIGILLTYSSARGEDDING